jgi:hypothetical protein
MKKIFIDRLLKKYIVPSEVRDLSVYSSGTIYTHGTRIPLPENLKFIRLFTAWGTKNKKHASFDIDLSSSFVKGNEMSNISFYNQSSRLAQYSGDWMECFKWNDKKVVAEFIDIDLEEAKDLDYILSSQYIFSSGELKKDYHSDVIVYSGVMFLEERSSSKEEIDISDAFLKFKLSGDYQSHISVAIDLKTNELVIIDSYSEEKNRSVANKGKLELFKKRYFNAIDTKENMFNFFTMYAKANNLEIVENISDSDIIISYKDFQLEKDQELFNVSNNLEKIISLLN